MINKTYEKLKAKGIDMAWYERSKRLTPSAKQPVALNDEYCGLLSIYLLQRGGKLFTTKPFTGEPYMLARIISTKVKAQVYLCVHCGEQFNNYKEAIKHYERKTTTPKEAKQKAA